jgi:hypothetical protein
MRGDDGREFDILEAIDALPWVRQLCPLMPHEYVVLFKSPDWAWFALDAMVRGGPNSYRAHFRGYPSPNRYWQAPDALRYWRTGIMLNRCKFDSVEPLRRVDEGAKPIKGWDGPPWAPNGSGLYLEVTPGKYRPTAKALADGFQPCNYCRRRPAGATLPRS